MLRKSKQQRNKAPTDPAPTDLTALRAPGGASEGIKIYINATGPRLRRYGPISAPLRPAMGVRYNATNRGNAYPTETTYIEECAAIRPPRGSDTTSATAPPQLPQDPSQANPRSHADPRNLHQKNRIMYVMRSKPVQIAYFRIKKGVQGAGSGRSDRGTGIIGGFERGRVSPVSTPQNKKSPPSSRHYAYPTVTYIYLNRNTIYIPLW